MLLMTATCDGDGCDAFISSSVSQIRRVQARAGWRYGINQIGAVHLPTLDFCPNCKGLYDERGRRLPGGVVQGDQGFVGESIG